MLNFLIAQMTKMTKSLNRENDKKLIKQWKNA